MTDTALVAVKSSVITICPSSQKMTNIFNKRDSSYLLRSLEDRNDPILCNLPLRSFYH